NIVEIVDGVSYGSAVGADGSAAIRADGRYEYDALYQLVSAEGRDHPGQQPGPADTTLHANDLQGLRRYLETFEYHQVGTLTLVKHQALDGTGAAWRREYEYPPGTNRLAATSTDADPPGVRSARHAHDPAGNMVAMP